VKDLYKILGVTEKADQDALKKAYRQLAKEYHPDVTGGDKKKTERFKEVNEAYAVLGDEKKRREYDRLKHSPVGMDGMPQGFDPEMFSQVFGGGAEQLMRSQVEPVHAPSAQPPLQVVSSTRYVQPPPQLLARPVESVVASRQVRDSSGHCESEHVHASPSQGNR